MNEATTTSRALTLFYPKNDKTEDESRDITISTISTTTTPLSTTTAPPATKIEQLPMQASAIKIDEFLENKIDLSTDLKPKEFEKCENILVGWSCSSGTNQHSVCIRQCQNNAHSESIKCKCKHNSCRWEQKGKSCTRHLNQGTGGWNNPLSKQTNQENMNPLFFSDQRLMDPNIGTSVSGDNFLNNSDNNQQNKKPEIINLNQIGGRIPERLSVGTRNIEFDRTPDESSFAQLFRDLKLSNTGQMVFNVNYNFNNYPSAL